MFAVFKRSAGPVVDLPAAPASQSPTIDLGATVRAVSLNASSIGREAAEVRGTLEITMAAAAEQAHAMVTLTHQVEKIADSQNGICDTSNESLAAVERARIAVQAVGVEVGGIVGSLKQVSSAAGTITQIALQTRLVAFNASVEAKRAGEAGRGFGVVADAVKDLAAQVERSSKHILSTVSELDARIATLSREIQLQEGSARQGAFQRALADVQDGVRRIASAADQSRSITAVLNTKMGSIEGGIKESGAALSAALKRSESFLTLSENLIVLVAGSGIETVDTPFIEAAIQAAGQLEKLLEDAVRSSVISMADLFDQAYVEIPKTQPKQHSARFNALTDRLFPQVQERVLGLNEKVVFCIAADRNGYISTHNKIYCSPQRGDVIWDTAHSRYRRIFNDRTGLASARNKRPFLLQTYRRDMGGGDFVVMKEVAVPITVNGQHWGGLRLAFKF